MLETIRTEWSAKLLVILFILLSIWWLVLNVGGLTDRGTNYLFGATYGIIALVGGIIGITISHNWGFTKSIFGKAILLLSIGLLAQEFGQLVFSYYNIFLGNEVPYPSFADIGFFGNIPLYIFGVWYLSRAAGAQFTTKKLSGKVQIILLPIIMLAVSYFFFLQNYNIVETSVLQVFLDFGYPLGQAIYVSIALLVYILSKSFLGGAMKSKVLFLLLALIVQYLADFNFLYQNSRGTWLNAGYGDYLYLLAYFMMAMGIIQLKTIFKKLRHSE